MKARILIATILIIIGALIHTIGGELININTLLNTDISGNLKIEIRAVWYLVAIDFFISGAYLTYFFLKKRLKENKALIHFIGIRMFLYGIVFLILIFFSNIELLFLLPQWILLLSIGILLEWDYFKK